ncbi:MAG: undecaprenyldiphospho-muramoylpentapeptide beta-N-acetylglucosaminyltransferase [bacterium]|nr:undecaprenyldiphospho-muramoylpentapeptide beta-N-acetylglucosaminyltransferase [bacterium]
MAIKVILTGGGTGGHAYPVIAVAQAIREYDPQAEFLWIGSRDGHEREVAAQADIAFKSIPTGKLRRYFSAKTIVDLIKIPFGILRAYFILSQFNPDVVFSKGGFVSYPTVFAAWLKDIPIVTHESDAIPGLATRRVANKATLIATSFPIVPQELPRGKTVYSGQPIRLELLNGNAERARQRFGLSNDRPVLAVFGGSQGAAAINQAIVQILPDLLPHFQVVHQVGPKNVAEMQQYAEKYKERGYRALGFFEDEMADLYALADVIVSRAGSQIHEYAALGKLVILIPLPDSGSNHQVMNAFTFQKQGAASMLEQANLTPELLRAEIMQLLRDESLRQSMPTAIKKFFTPNAAKKIAYWVMRAGRV